MYSVDLRNVDRTKLAIVGGKGANLGELFRIEGVQVPNGFCVTVDAFRQVVGKTPSLPGLLDQLAQLTAEDQNKIRALSAEIRSVIERLPIPDNIQAAVIHQLSAIGQNDAYAVRSSATAEDLPTASFAGQQDTYLNIRGHEAILQHISQCWASLFTDRAVTYRLQNGFNHRNVQLAVVIQKMIFPQASGILFTADPITGNRTVLSIDASFGLGEALVSGRVNADNYKVQHGKIVDKKIATKKLAIYGLKEGGTTEQAIALEQQSVQTLTDEQILQLALLGRTIEAHFGQPQDVEWCLADDTFYIVQSRPITTLFPIPDAADREPHVYISVGHQQMMTDALKPLGLSLWQLTAARPMLTAAGRLFVDVARDLASPARRTLIIDVLGKSDPLVSDALVTILERDDFIQLLPEETNELHSGKSRKGPSPADYQTLKAYNPAVVDELIEQSEASLESLKEAIQGKSGLELLDFILSDVQELRKALTDPKSFGVIMTAMNAASWVNDRMAEWLGEQAVADTLSQSVPNNVTSEMGLALLDVADVIRSYPEVIAYLQHGALSDGFLDELGKLYGGQESRDAIQAYLDRYGMRCAGEIDITRPRWRETPATLVPLILSNIKNFEPGAGKRKFEQGRQAALQKEKTLLDRLKQLPDGDQKADETRRMISLIRNLAGYREYPKYGIVSRYYVYKQALLNEAGRLAAAGAIQNKDDIYFLTLDELRDVIRTHKLDEQLISQRKDQYEQYKKLSPPRVITSDGEVITGAYKRKNLPANALVGLPVSSGIVEGRARVLLTLDDAELNVDDIVVTAFTDPSWTPLFVSIKGLITEVGGLMTHGAVIAREYGLPAVVGVENATGLIKDGQRIRVNGTDGYVEIL